MMGAPALFFDAQTFFNYQLAPDATTASMLLQELTSASLLLIHIHSHTHEPRFHVQLSGLTLT